MKIRFFVVFLFLSFSAIAKNDLDEVLDFYIAATGGKAAIEKVQSVEISLTIQEPKFTVDAVYRADRKIRMRIDVFSDGKRVFTEAFDGKKGWEMGEDGNAKDASPEGTAALRNGIFFPGKVFGLYELLGLGHKLSYEGREDVDGTSYHILKVVLDSGYEKSLYINPDNGRIERSREYRALHVDIDPKKQKNESIYSDFRKVDGLLFSFKTTETDRNTGEVVQIATVKDIKLNPEIDEAIFQKP